LLISDRRGSEHLCSSTSGKDHVIRQLLLALLIAASSVCAFAQAAGDAQGKPFDVEYYYKVKWGHADEFLRLWEEEEDKLTSCWYPLFGAGLPRPVLVRWRETSLNVISGRSAEQNRKKHS
jgi:hypothetical protein